MPCYSWRHWPLMIRKYDITLLSLGKLGGREVKTSALVSRSSWVRVESPVKVFHRHSESTEYTVLYTHRCRAKLYRLLELLYCESYDEHIWVLLRLQAFLSQVEDPLGRWQVIVVTAVYARDSFLPCLYECHHSGGCLIPKATTVNLQIVSEPTLWCNVYALLCLFRPAFTGAPH